jgi:hypothetical protein
MHAELCRPVHRRRRRLIAHHVEISLLPNWIGGIQYRKARLQNSCLELRPREPILIHGEPRNAKLVWRRTRINQ